MTVYRKRRPWLCPKCGTRNEHRTSSRRCGGCGEDTKRAKRVAAHARVLQETPAEAAAQLSQLIHGGDLGECGCCGRPKPERGNHDRDHGHRDGEASYGKIRGLACYRCNNVYLRNHTFGSLLACAAYFARAELHHGADDERMRSFLAWFDATVAL